MRRTETRTDRPPAASDRSFDIWALRGTDGGAAGLEFARAKVEPAASLLVHAAPATLDVEVFANGERLIATGRRLRPAEATDSPMTRLTIDGVRVRRTAVWPTEQDLGSIVLLPGGEAGVLRSWRGSEDRRSWVWSLELTGGEA
jgi:hypothetical protein